MKIYLVYEESGEWEDYNKILSKGFLSKQKAEEYKLNLEQEEKERQEQIKKCNECPYKYGDGKENEKCNCKKFKLDEYGYCENYDCIYEKYWYSLEEIEVEK